MTRSRTILIGAGVVLALLASACQMPARTYVSNPVWVGTGRIYYYESTFDGPQVLHERSASGATAAVSYRQPKEVGGGECDGTPPRLFSWPNGQLGLQFDHCGEVTYYYQMAAAGHDVELVTAIHDGRDVAWLDDGRSGYAAQASGTCMGVSPVRDGTVRPLSGPLSIGGRQFRLDAVASGQPCTQPGAAFAPFAADTRYWGFLYGPDIQPGGRSASRAGTWYICLWRTGWQYPKIIGSSVGDAIWSSFDPVNGWLAVSSGLHSTRTEILGVGDGSGRRIREVAGKDPAFSPDGTRIAYVNNDDKLAIADLKSG